MRINNNLGAMNAQRNMNINSSNASKSMEKLSSGLRINRAGDDAAGLSISEKMRAQIKGLNQASTNAQDGISMIQTAEGALNETHSILQRMRELSVQSSNDTNASADRDAIQSEMDQLTSEINRIAGTTEFNTQKLLNGEKSTVNTLRDSSDPNGGKFEFEIKSGAATISIDSTAITISAATTDAKMIAAISAKVGGSYTVEAKDGKITLTEKAARTETSAPTVTGAKEQSVKLQIGANQGQTIDVSISNMSSKALGLSTDANSSAGFTSKDSVSSMETGSKEYGLDVSDATKAGSAIEKINSAIEKVSGQRSALGATQNRLEHTINNLNTSSENLTAAESRIRDTDMATEMNKYSKDNILQQAAQAMLAQAKSAPQSVLQLLN